MQFPTTETRLGIVGPGLLGGSVALAWKERFGFARLMVWGRREESLEEARRVLPDEVLTTDLKQLAAQSDLIVLATPVGVMPRVLETMIDGGLKPGAIVTDVGSVKGLVEEQLQPLMSGQSAHFVGSHPMAGSDQGGFAAARRDLLEGAACVVTGTGEAADKVEAFWECLGSRVYRMSPRAHDEAIAKVSHLPHLLACLGIFGALEEDPALGELAGGGLRDTTRVAAGAPGMWTEILMENREALMAPLDHLAEQVRDLQAILSSGDDRALHSWLDEAKKLRDPLNHY